MMALGDTPGRLAKEVAEEYASSLADLTINSKPLINMLTILAEESIDHAAVIVQSVEQHLEKVPPEMKLPVLYLVDSIVKNVGRQYTQLFAHVIVNMFCNVFKLVDERTRSQMFKLRETWHDVFPGFTLYRLDAKVNVLDPAWPIQARPQQTNIHVNPDFLNRAGAITTTVTPTPSISTIVSPDVLRMQEELARKQQELKRLQKIEREIMEQKKAIEKKTASQQHVLASMIRSDVVPPVVPIKELPLPVPATVVPVTPRIAPANPALVNMVKRRDPRLAHMQTPLSQSSTPAHETSTASTIAPKRPDPRMLRKTEISPREVTPPKHEKTFSVSKGSHRHSDKKKDKSREHSDRKSIHISKLPPIPKLKSLDKQNDKQPSNDNSTSPTKRKKDNDSIRSNRRHKKSKDDSPKESEVPKKSSLDDGKRTKSKKREPELEKEEAPMETFKKVESRSKDRNYVRRNREKSESPEGDVDLRSQTHETPATVPVSEPVSNGTPSGDVDLRSLSSPTVAIVSPAQRKRSPSEPLQHEPNKKSKLGKLDELFGNEDVDLRKMPIVDESVRPDITTNSPQSPPQESPTKSTVKTSDNKEDKESEDEDEEMEVESSYGNIRDVEGGWAKVKEIQSPQVILQEPSMSNLDMVRAKLAKATEKDGLGRLRIFSTSEDGKEKKKSNKDTDMRLKNKRNFDGDSIDSNIHIIMSQAKEQLQTGNMNKDQYNVLLLQVFQLNEKQKLKEAKQKESLEASKRRLNWLQRKKGENSKSGDEARDRSTSPESERSTDSPIRTILLSNPSTVFGDIDERIPPSIMLPAAPFTSLSEEDQNLKQKDLDLRILNEMPDNNIMSRHEMNAVLPRSDPKAHPRHHPSSDVHLPFPDNNMMPPMPDLNMHRLDGMFPTGAPWPSGPRGFVPRNFRGPRPRGEDWGNPRGFRGRGPMGGNWRMPGSNRPMMDEIMALPNPPFLQVEPRKGIYLGPNPLPPYVRDERSSPPPLGPSSFKDFIRLDNEVLNYLQRDTMKSISIDGVNREIRFYDSSAIVLLDWDDPRDIFFQPGQRKVTVDDQTFPVHFNEDYTTFRMDGIVHKIKFGAPTRELFIDDMWFECFFGGPPIPILLDGKVRLIKLDGPPPQVTIGEVKRTHLCAGKINLIVEATNMIPIFLDAKPQLVEIGGVPHCLRFVDALETVLINEKPYKVEFGGLPKPLTVNKKKHYIRFTVLPRTVRAGAVNILNMEGRKPDPIVVESVAPILPPAAIPVAAEPENSSIAGLDILASIMPSSVAPSPQIASYSATQQETTPAAASEEPTKNLDISSLFAKLVATGLLQNLQNPSSKKEPENTTNSDAPTTKSAPVTTTKKEPKAEEKPPEPPTGPKYNVVNVNWLKSETLRVKQQGLVHILHSGMQCGSCGARFPPEHTTKYSQHLDWHFRQNRAEKDSQRRPHSRRWYYDISDWLQFEEIEDLEEREKSYFERQLEEGAAQEASEAIPSIQEEVSVAAPPPSAPPHQFRCSHCGDRFHQFYNQELEEWQLRKAVNYEGNNYHPDCLEEYKTKMADGSSHEISGADESLNASKEDIFVKDDDWEVEETESIDIKDDEENVSAETQDDEDESVVEVLSEKSQEEDVELLDDDDVVIKTEPVVEITVEDVDTDEETEAERAARDEQFKIDFANIKIKQEPIDPDDEPVITSTEIITPHADTTHPSVISSIDGNVQLQPATVPTTTVPTTIRINITKPLGPASSSTPPHKPSDNTNTQVSEDEILEEEPEFTVKESLVGVNFKKYPTRVVGHELSGLCSIM